MITVQAVDYEKAKIPSEYLTVVMFLGSGQQLVISALTLENALSQIRLHKPVCYTISGRHI